MLFSCDTVVFRIRFRIHFLYSRAGIKHADDKDGGSYVKGEFHGIGDNALGSRVADAAPSENEWKKRILANGMNEYDYLCNITIMYVSFEGTDSNDHAHCELCWDKFSNNATDLHNGYITLDKKIRLCPECVHDFRKLFHWTVKNDPPLRS